MIYERSKHRGRVGESNGCVINVRLAISAVSPIADIMIMISLAVSWWFEHDRETLCLSAAPLLLLPSESSRSDCPASMRDRRRRGEGMRKDQREKDKRGETSRQRYREGNSGEAKRSVYVYLQVRESSNDARAM